MSTTHSRTWDCGKPTEHNLSKAVKMLPGQTNDRISRKSRFTGSDAPKRSLNFRLRASSPLQPNYSLESISSTSHLMESVLKNIVVDSTWTQWAVGVWLLNALWKTDVFARILSLVGHLGFQHQPLRSLNPKNDGISASGPSADEWDWDSRNSESKQIGKNDFSTLGGLTEKGMMEESPWKMKVRKIENLKITGMMKSPDFILCLTHE